MDLNYREGLTFTHISELGRTAALRVKRHLLRAAFGQNNWCLRKTAEALKTDPGNLYREVKKHHPTLHREIQEAYDRPKAAQEMRERKRAKFPLWDWKDDGGTETEGGEP